MGVRAALCWWGCVVAAGAAINLWAFLGYPYRFTFTENGAAWMQTVGSVAAILVAVWVARSQASQARQLALDSQEQTLRIAQDSLELSERLANRELVRADEAKEQGQDRSATWLALMLADLIEESDRNHFILAGSRIRNAEVTITDQDRRAIKSRISVTRFAHGSSSDQLLQHCQHLPIAAAAQVMKAMRYLSHYRAHAQLMAELSEEPDADYATLRDGFQQRTSEARRVREAAKGAYDAVQPLTTTVLPRNELFTRDEVRHLADPVEPIV